MNFCIVENGVIENIIVCEDNETAEALGAFPAYEGADIGSTYNPPHIPPATPEYSEVQLLGQQMTELELMLLSHIDQTAKEETV